jgi:hypothetical protein
MKKIEALFLSDILLKKKLVIGVKLKTFKSPLTKSLASGERCIIFMRLI